jgi:putative ABC transport system permease protein
VVVDRELLDGPPAPVHPQLWIRGDPDRILPALDTAGLPRTGLATAREVHGIGVYEAVTSTFRFMTALSVLTGTIVSVLLLLVLDARSRQNRVSSVLLRRMGVGSGAFWCSLLVETGGLLLLGGAVAVAMSFALVALARPAYDLDQGTPPGTLLDLPWDLVVAIGVQAVALAAVAATVAWASSARAVAADVLREE